VYTNIVERDPDIHHFSYFGLMMPGFRVTADMPVCEPGVSHMPVNGMRDNWMRGPAGRPQPDPTIRKLWWMFALPYRMLFTTCGPSFLWSTVALVSGSFMSIVPHPALPWRTVCGYLLSRTVVIWLLFVHPYIFFFSMWQFSSALMFLTLPYFIHGLIFYVFSQVSHIQTQCFDPPPSGGCSMTGVTGEWAAHQVAHTHDYAVGSRLMLHISNGLNLQTVHHLFPQVAWQHYVDLVPILEETCEQFGIRWTPDLTFWNALRSHFSYVYSTNSTDLKTAASEAFCPYWETLDLNRDFLIVAEDYENAAHLAQSRITRLQRISSKSSAPRLNANPATGEKASLLCTTEQQDGISPGDPPQAQARNVARVIGLL